jgi:hypothetical protein
MARNDLSLRECLGILVIALTFVASAVPTMKSQRKRCMMITGVILNWERPANVQRIVEGWLAGGLVTEAIVWNNNASAPLPPIAGAKIVNAGQDLGLYTRFAAACLAQHDCVLIQDDDLEVPHASLAALHAEWQADPAVIHGVFGRAPKPDGSYARRIRGDMNVPIVLTRALLADRRYAARFFDIASLFAGIQSEGQPEGNGEDILFSYTVRHASGRLNRVHRVAVTELPSPNSIHRRDWQAHINHRTRLLRACEAWLQEKTHEVRCEVAAG